MSDPTLSPPKFAVGQKVFAVRSERLLLNSASPVAIGTVAAPVGHWMNERRYIVTGTDAELTHFERELHATAAEAMAAVRVVMDHQRAVIDNVEENAIAYIEANQ